MANGDRPLAVLGILLNIEKKFTRMRNTPDV